MECLSKSSQPAIIHSAIDTKVLDGVAIVHMVRPGLVEHLRSRPIPSKCFFRISPLCLKLSAEYTLFGTGI